MNIFRGFPCISKLMKLPALISKHLVLSLSVLFPTPQNRSIQVIHLQCSFILRLVIIIIFIAHHWTVIRGGRKLKWFLIRYTLIHSFSVILKFLLLLYISYCRNHISHQLSFWFIGRQGGQTQETKQQEKWVHNRGDEEAQNHQ